MLAQGDLFGNVGLADVLLVAGVVMLLIFFMSRYRHRKHNAPPTRLSVQERMEKQKQTLGMKEDMQQVMVEIETMSRRVGAQLDAKAAKLEQLITEADRRIAQLQKLESTSTPTQAGHEAAPKHTMHDRVAQNETMIADSVEGPESGNDPLARRVYALADQGLDATAIAGELREHIGKVELILALRVK